MRACHHKTSEQIDGFSLNLSNIYDIGGHRTLVLFTSLYSTARTLLEEKTAVQPLKKLRASYGTENSSQEFTSAATEAHIK
jgi:hypothetical protein